MPETVVLLGTSRITTEQAPAIAFSSIFTPDGRKPLLRQRLLPRSESDKSSAESQSLLGDEQKEFPESSLPKHVKQKFAKD